MAEERGEVPGLIGAHAALVFLFLGAVGIREEGQQGREKEEGAKGYRVLH